MKKILGFALGVAMVLTLFSVKPASAASGWKYLRSDAVTSSFACKTAVNSPYYGPLWRITTLSFDRTNGDAPNRGIGVYVNINRNGQTVNETGSNSWWNGMISTNSTYASQLFEDRVYVGGAYYTPALNESIPARDLFDCQ